MLLKSKFYFLISCLSASFLSACSATPSAYTPSPRVRTHPIPAPHVPVAIKKRVITHSVKRPARRSVKPRPAVKKYTRRKLPAPRKPTPVMRRPRPVPVATTRQHKQTMRRPARPIIVAIPTRKKVIATNGRNPYESVPQRRNTAASKEVLLPATKGLLAQAESATSRQQYSSAISYLERALRIEPNNPIIWTELAKTYYDKGNDARTIVMAKKSNLYSTSGSALERKNWSIIKMASKRSGNIQSLKDALRYERNRS
ncbi:MAG: tetratricopeptide repeat protein [Thiotrichaceae bacterium]|nr:tetratricopeptide repeat protein [Thiotrichaceae bacterium]